MLNELDVKPYIYMCVCVSRKPRVHSVNRFDRPLSFVAAIVGPHANLICRSKARDNRVIDRTPL